MSELSPAKIKHSLKKILKFFTRERIPYLLIGGMALSLWGRPRTTLDVDFLILVDAEDMNRIKVLTRQAGFVLDRKWLKWNPLLRESQIRLHMGQLRIDLMRPRDRHDREAFKRQRRRRLGTLSCSIISPEDLILQKLKVGRPRDFEDALTIFERQRTLLDKKYLHRWADRLGILNELSYIQKL